MKMKFLIFIILTNVACSGINKSTSTNTVENLKSTNLKQINVKRKYVQTEQAKFKITAIKQVDSNLKIDVQYGGCGKEHDFEMISNGKTDSKGIVDIYIVDHTVGDNCKMLLMRTITFDISKISKKKENIGFRVNDGTILNFEK